MTDAVIQEELLKHTKIKIKAGETAAALTTRVLDKINKMADAEPESWKALTEATQEWVNSNVTAQSSSGELDLLVVETEAEAETDEDPAPAEEAAAEEPKKERSVPKTKAAGKKAGKPPTTKKAPPAAKPVKVAPKKVAPVKAKSAKTNGAGRGRTPLHPDTGVIKVLVKDNPHREGTIRDKAFKKVKTGMTVAEAVKAGCPAQQIWSMANRKLISVTAR